MEIELKLSGNPDALKDAFASATIRAKATDRGQSKRLENIYYDTEDQRLRARGLAFRVRKDGRHYYQTLKSNDAGGLAAYRGEWQTPLRSSEPDLALMPAGATAVLDGLVRSDELRAVFTTQVRRLVRRIEAADRNGRSSLVEAALDLGTIESNGASLPIAELELELLDGSPDALYALALELDALAPLHVETRSKSARGYALATGAAPAWHKAEPLAFATAPRSTTPSRRSCATASSNGAPTRRRHTTAAIPKACTRCAWRSGACARRCRCSAAARPGQARLAERRGEGDREQPRPGARLGRVPGELLAPVTGAARTTPTWLGSPRRRKRPDEGLCEARAAIEAPSYTRYMLQLRGWIEARGWREALTERGEAWLDRPTGDFAAHVLGKRQRKALKLGRDFAELSAKDRHKVRIALKKLRYATEFFPRSMPRSAPSLSRRAQGAPG